MWFASTGNLQPSSSSPEMGRVTRETRGSYSCKLTKPQKGYDHGPRIRDACAIGVEI